MLKLDVVTRCAGRPRRPVESLASEAHCQRSTSLPTGRHPICTNSRLFMSRIHANARRCAVEIHKASGCIRCFKAPLPALSSQGTPRGSVFLFRALSRTTKLLQSATSYGNDLSFQIPDNGCWRFWLSIRRTGVNKKQNAKHRATRLRSFGRNLIDRRFQPFLAKGSVADRVRNIASKVQALINVIRHSYNLSLTGRICATNTCWITYN